MIGEMLRERGYVVDSHVVLGDPDAPDVAFPDPQEYDAVVAFGSFSNAYDPRARSWIEPELGLIRTMVHQDIPFLGVCFGGQLLASSLGGSVHRSAHPEIGWTDVDTDDESLVPSGPWFQWHFDRFTTPPGARAVARNASAVQASQCRQQVVLTMAPCAGGRGRAVLGGLGTEHQAPQRGLGIGEAQVGPRQGLQAHLRLGGVVRGTLDVEGRGKEGVKAVEPDTSHLQQQILPAGEVAVGGRWRHADPGGELPQRQALDVGGGQRGVEQGLPQVAVVKAPGRRCPGGRGRGGRHGVRHGAMLLLFTCTRQLLMM